MFLVVGIASHPNSIVRNFIAVLNGDIALTPFKIEDIVGDVVPVFANVLRVVNLFVDAARLVIELSAGCPGGSQGP